MGHSASGLKQHRLSLPARHEDIEKLQPGSIVFLDGLVYTAREGVYQRILADGEKLPVDDLASVSNVNFHCSPAAAPDDRERPSARAAALKLP